MVMFPSYLLHTVYPFIGKEERRCIAFNGISYNHENKTFIETLSELTNET